MLPLTTKLQAASASFATLTTAECLIVIALGATVPYFKADKHRRHKAALIAIGVVHNAAMVAVWGRLWLAPPPAVAADKIFGYDRRIEHLALYTTGMELWNFAHELLYNGGSYEMLAHHSIVALLSWWTTRPFFQAYSCYFMGLANVSTTVLYFFLAFRYFPELQRLAPQSFVAAQASFALTFFLFRIVGWTAVCAQWLPQALALLAAADTGAELTVKCVVTLAAFVVLTLMQFSWGYKIARGLAKMLAPKSSKSSK